MTATITDADHALALLREACECYHHDPKRYARQAEAVDVWDTLEAKAGRYHPQIQTLMWAFERVVWAYMHGAAENSRQIRATLGVSPSDPWASVALWVDGGRV